MNGDRHDADADRLNLLIILDLLMDLLIGRSAATACEH